MAPNPAPSGTASGAGHRAAAGLDSAAEVERLRALIEKQPSCLMRVGTDGTLLAVSDAALGLLGASELAQVLNTSFVERLHGEVGSVWADFADRVSHSGSASAECEMTDLSGARRAVILLGVGLPDHPDGRASVIVTVRDVSTARRLEVSLQEQEGLRRSIEEERTQLAAALADRQRLERAAAADRAAIQKALDDATANVQQLRARLEEAIADRRQLHASLDQAVAQRQQIAASVEQLTSALSAAVDAASLARQILWKQAPK